MLFRSIHGNPISAGNTEHYCKNSDSLKTFPVFEWSNLLFSTEINFSESIDLSHLILVESRVDTVNSNIKNIMNIFLDVDHIPVLHTGVYESVGFDTVTVDTVKWSFYKNGSVQTVKENALWAAIYPNTMVEWQGGAVFITVAVEKNINESKVLVYKYRNLNMSDYEWHINESAWETAWAQDKMQAENIIGNTTTSRLELAKQHYAEWLEQGN